MAKVENVVAATTRIALEHLMATDPVSLYELVELCRDPQHELRGSSGDRLRSLSLIDDSGKVHDSVREAVLASVQGDGLDLSLR